MELGIKHWQALNNLPTYLYQWTDGWWKPQFEAVEAEGEISRDEAVKKLAGLSEMKLIDTFSFISNADKNTTLTITCGAG